MIYDLLIDYKKKTKKNFQNSTAKTYYKKLCTLFEGQSISDTVGKLDIDKILDKLGEIKHKSTFSQSKNAFLHFCEYQGIELSYDTLERINELQKATRKKRRKLNNTDFNKINKKIISIRIKRLKMSYQVMLATGLRVSELASISPLNCQITNDDIKLPFTARGGADDVISIPKTSYPKLYKNLSQLIENISQGQDKRLFYSTDYLQKKAKAHGFSCHDLRRSFAKIEYKKSRSKAVVMKQMRHKSMKATNIYLRSKIKV